MITSELISYIKRQLENNVSKDLIASKLIGAGWRESDVREGFLNIGSDYEIKIPETPKIEIKKEETVIIKETPKVEEEIEVQNIELPVFEPKKAEQVVKETPKVWTPSSIPIREIKTETPVIQPTPTIKKEFVSAETPQITKEVEQKPRIEDTRNISKVAMISSYQSDMMSLSKKKEEIILPKKKFSFKWIIIVVILLALSYLAWAFVNGSLNFKDINISALTPKDSKTLILNNSQVLSSLKSYKTETNIEILSPSFANPISGLITGDVSSAEKDSILINTLGILNKSEEGVFSDSFITIKGSLVKDYINIDVKSNGSDLFVTIPDLSKETDKLVPPPSTVKINKEEFDLVPTMFSKEKEGRLKMVNLYNLISGGLSSYIENDTLSVYNELVKNANITEIGVESIKGIETHHYTISTDNTSSKNLLTKVAEYFTLNLLDEDKVKLADMIDSIKIKSFDLWIGKDDNNIYQYSVSLDIPLSTILEAGDKNIDGSNVSISFKTTYYDLNIQNNIFMPSLFTPASDFINNAKEIRFKNMVFSFRKLADVLYEKEKSYGVKSNTSGSCLNPVAGSLFSPLSHSVNLSQEVKDISDLMNEILGITNGNGFCYSTTKDWSFTIPISESYETPALPQGGYTSFFCVDSTGAKENLTSYPKGSFCTPKVETKKEVNPKI